MKFYTQPLGIERSASSRWNSVVQHGEVAADPLGSIVLRDEVTLRIPDKARNPHEVAHVKTTLGVERHA